MKEATDYTTMPLRMKCSAQDCTIVPLGMEYSAMVQRKLPRKLKDPGSFSIPCTIGRTKFENALCDLGASVSLMPKSVFNKLGLGDLSPTNISLQLADRSIRYPEGMLVDVPIRVGDMWVPGDFVVIDMKEDDMIPIILGRPFLATCGAIIDVKNGMISLSVGKDKIVFSTSADQSHQCPATKELASIKRRLESLEFQRASESFRSYNAKEGPSFGGMPRQF